jgi:hypothetical protein
MGHHYLNEPREPTRQEQLVVPEPPQRPPRARKDRRRWCGGHVGREHEPTVRMGSSVYVSYRRARNEALCGWRPRYRRLRVGERIPEDARARGHGMYSVIDRYVWSCSHELGCERCGKILEDTIGRRCPDYHERAGG